MAKISTVSEAANKFAVDLHGALNFRGDFTGKNLFYSPSSLCNALGMAYAGARSTTATEMAKALYWEELEAEQQLHKQMKELTDALNAANSAKNELSVANRIFVQKDFEIVPAFEEICKKFYNAEAVGRVDFKSHSEVARNQVNDWVEDKTKRKIRNLVHQGVFNTRTRATLVNAVYFKGLWEKQFKKEETYPTKFKITTITEDVYVDVEMMYQRSKFRYNEKHGCKLLEMPYAGGEISMVLILPNEMTEMTMIERHLTHETLQDAVSCVTRSRPVEVEVSIPKFKMTEYFELREMLRALGIDHMFDEFKADLSGMTAGPERVFVSKVLHKAFIDVNEEGTEAAAATAVVSMTSGMTAGPERVFVSKVLHKAFIDVNEEGTEAAAATAVVSMTRSVGFTREVACFRADHQFLFLIRHCKSNSILFMGQVANPAPSQ